MIALILSAHSSAFPDCLLRLLAPIAKRLKLVDGRQGRRARRDRNARSLRSVDSIEVFKAKVKVGPWKRWDGEYNNGRHIKE